jgi:hypothetical protein
LHPPSRTKPATVIPATRAVSTASADGAETATIASKPAAQAFCTISNDFVDRIVAANVFSKNQNVSIAVERGGRMHSTSSSKEFLIVPNAINNAQQEWRWPRLIRRQRRESCGEFINLCRTTDPAR